MTKSIDGIAEKLHDLNGSELKAIIAIYSEGRYLNSTDLMNITGMARKTCNKVLQSEHVKEAVKNAESMVESMDKITINKMRRLLSHLEESHAE